LVFGDVSKVTVSHPKKHFVILFDISFINFKREGLIIFSNWADIRWERCHPGSDTDGGETVWMERLAFCASAK
jgi:hypothetical protein